MKTKILRILLGLCAIFAAHAQTITEDGQHKELAYPTEQTCYIALEPTNGTINFISWRERAVRDMPSYKIDCSVGRL